MSSNSIPPIQVVIQADDKTAAAFRAAVDRINTIAPAAEKAARSLSGIESGVQQLLKPFSQLGGIAGGALSSIEGQFSSLASAVGSGSIAIGIGGIVAAGVAAAGALGTLAVAGGAYAQRLDLISQKTGISIRDLQTFEAAGRTVNVSLEDLVTASRKFDQALSDSGKNSAAQQTILKALGITAKDPKEALLQVADAFAKIQDPALKSSDALLLFGRSGLNMIPFLNLGREGLKQFDDIVEQFGPHITKDGVERFDQWEVATTKLSQSWGRFKEEAAGLLPVLTSVVEAAAKFANAFNSPQLQPPRAVAAPKTDPRFGKQQAGEEDFVGFNVATGQFDNLIDSQLSNVRLEAAKQLKSQQQEYFDLVKAGSQAQLALEQKQAEVAEYVAAKDFERAAAAQKQIPSLQAAVDLEKERLEALKKQAELAARFAGTPVSFTGQDKLDDLKALGTQMIQDAKDAEKLSDAIFEISKKFAVLDTSGIQKLPDGLSQFIASGGSKSQSDVDAKAFLNIADLYKNAGLSAQEYTIEAQKLHNELRRGTITQQQYDEAVKSLTDSLGGVRGGFKLFYDEFVNTPNSSALLTLDLLTTGVQGFEQNLADTLVKGKADWADYFGSLAEMIIKFETSNILQGLLSQLATTGIGSFLGIGSGLSSSVGSVADNPALSGTQYGLPGFHAKGGQIDGPGTDTSDSIPSWLSKGEFVVRGAVVKQPGVLELLKRLNDSGTSAIYPQKSRYAGGGLVSGSSAPGGWASSAPSVVVNVTNQSSQPVNARAKITSLDAKQMVVGIVLEDFKSNGPIRKAINNG